MHWGFLQLRGNPESLWVESGEQAPLPRLYHIYKDNSTGNVGDLGVNQRSVTSPGQTRLDPVPKDKVKVMGLYLSLFIRHTSHIKYIPA